MDYFAFCIFTDSNNLFLVNIVNQLSLVCSFRFHYVYKAICKFVVLHVPFWCK